MQSRGFDAVKQTKLPTIYRTFPSLSWYSHSTRLQMIVPSQLVNSLSHQRTIFVLIQNSKTSVIFIGIAKGGGLAMYSASVCVCVWERERETLPHHPLNTHAHTYTPDTSNGFFQDHMSFASAQQQYSLYNYSQARRERQTCCIIEGGRWKVEGIKLCV